MNPSENRDTPPDLIGQIDWAKAVDGLVPAIVQHSASGAVLMMAWMDRQALNTTLTSGRVTFFSRSRQSQWTKGETSGNFLDFVSATVDCDGDTLLVLATPTGPACHTGTATCFGDGPAVPLTFLSRLQTVIEDRRNSDPGSSYTASLLAGPLHRIAQKVGEEAVETILAATSRDDDSLIDEAADLIYHLLVLLSAKNRNLEAVARRLVERHTEAAEVKSKK